MHNAGVPDDQSTTYVSRGGLKLRHALNELSLDVTDLACTDLGCSTGGFTDCLLQAGAASVVCVDTAYGQLAWKLRNDPRVRVMERTNALHAEPPEHVDLVVIDLGWTPQRLALPAAAKWLKPDGSIISLVKPHYEAPKGMLSQGGVLTPEDAERIADEVRSSLPDLGFTERAWTKSPVLGGAAGKRRKKGAGNAEWLVLCTPIAG